MGCDVSVSDIGHRVFGRLVAVTLAGGEPVRLTPDEAAIFARALYAVADGRSAEREIFMSPIASDADIAAAVGADGVTIRLGGGAALDFDWPATRALAAALTAASPG